MQSQPEGQQQSDETPERPDYDQALKRLLLRAHDGFLALVAPDVKWIGELSPELPAIARRADLVWEVEQPDGQRGILHVELQTKPETDIGERLAEYDIRLYRRDQLPIRSIVVFLRQAATIPASPFVIDWMGKRRLEFVFDVIRIWEIPPERVLETDYYELWPLVGLMAGITPETTVEVAERIVAAPVPIQERDEFIRLLVLLAGMRMPRRALSEALRRKPMIEDLWKESSLGAALEELAEERGMERGLQRGLEQGMQQGMQQAAQSSVRLVLEGRFGTLDEDVLTAITQADKATLDGVLLHAATDSLEQIRARLGLS